METQKQVVHFEAKKGFTTAQSNEHQRRWTERGWAQANENGRIDRSRTRLNFEVTKGGKVQKVDKSKSIPEKFLENITSRGIKDPNEKWPDNPKYRTVVDFIISGSHERLCQLAFGNQKINYEKGANNGSVQRRPEIERWAKDMYDVLAGRFGEENILSFVVHLDERSPHIHADIIPVTDGNDISFNKVFVGGDKYEYRRRTLALHDLFAAVNRKWGLQRGDSVNETHRKHHSTEEYRRKLSGQCSTLEREVDSKSATLKTLNQQIAQAAKSMKGLNTMDSNLDAGRARIEAEIDSIRRSLSDDGLGTDRRDALRQKEESLQKKLDDILAKLADKRGKLKDAEKRLAEAPGGSIGTAAGRAPAPDQGCHLEGVQDHPEQGRDGGALDCPSRLPGTEKDGVDRADLCHRRLAPGGHEPTGREHHHVRVATLHGDGRSGHDLRREQGRRRRPQHGRLGT